MKQNYKAILMTGAAIVGVLAFAVTAKEVSSEDIEAAHEKAKSLLERVTPISPNVEDNRRVPVLPTMAEQGMQMNTPSNDPFVVAERVKNSAPNLGFDPNESDKAGLMVFVSFSMPEASLNRLAMETAKAGGTLVLRGFVEDSLKKTVAASEKMTNLGASLQINPQLYQEYAVDRVPAYVIARRTDDGITSCAGGVQCVNHIKLTGDASLHGVLERMAEDKNTDMAKIAGSKLARFEGL